MHLNCWRHLEFNFRSPTFVINISRDNKVFTSDPARQCARPQMFFNFVFVFVYTLIRGGAVRTSLDKKLDAEAFLFLSHGETFFMRNRVYAYLCIDVMN